MLNTEIGRFRLVSLLEGVSFLVLLGIAMPLKYAAGIPEAVRYVGWAHGLLFVLFILALLSASTAARWPLAKIAGAFIASDARADGCAGGPFCQNNHRGPFGGFFFKQPVPAFQAAPWYLYWPYNAHFQTPAPLSGAYYAPPYTGGHMVNPYFPAPQYQGVPPGVPPGAPAQLPPTVAPGNSNPNR